MYVQFSSFFLPISSDYYQTVLETMIDYVSAHLASGCLSVKCCIQLHAKRFSAIVPILRSNENKTNMLKQKLRLHSKTNTKLRPYRLTTEIFSMNFSLCRCAVCGIIAWVFFRKNQVDFLKLQKVTKPVF